MSDLSPNALTLTPGAPITAGSDLQYGGFANPALGIVTDSDSVVSTTATPGILDVGDALSVNGTSHGVTAITQYLTSVTYDNGASTATGVPFAIVTLDDGSMVGMFLDPLSVFGNTSSIQLDTVLGSGGFDESDVSAAGVGLSAPDGVVDGLATGEAMGSGYTDFEGDQINNSGNAIDGNAGNDTIYGGTGDDTIDGGADNDWVFGGDGQDQLSGGDGNDSIWGDAGDDTLSGNDGNDKLIGGDGNDLLVGGEGNDTLYGDGVFGDNGGMSAASPAEAGAGEDTLVLDGGNDIAYGGSGDDEFQIFDGFGDHVIIGGETGETNGDTVNASALTEDVTVIYNGDEAGTIANGTSTTDFDEIERLDLGSGDDRVEVVNSTTGTVNGSDGFDTLVLPDAEPGMAAPVVTVTSSSPYPGIPGATTMTGYVDFADGSRLEFENFEEIICFTPGTLIDTLRGRVGVEDLAPGDKVLTRDHGYQPLAWVGRRDLSAADMARCPAAAPIRIAAGALGVGLPERDLMVSPRHRMLVTGARAELMFGEREVLVTAADLLGLPGVSQEGAGAVSYVHVMCDSHQIIRAEGSWTESFQPAEAVLSALDAATRTELLGLFPDLGTAGFASARPVLNEAEAATLFAA